MSKVVFHNGYRQVVKLGKKRRLIPRELINLVTLFTQGIYFIIQEEIIIDPL